MAIDNKTVHTIAHLARLEIEQSKVPKYTAELSKIIGFVEQMDACDTSDIEPMTHPFDATLRLRQDKVTETNQRDRFQAIAPSTEDGLYLVPKVID